MATDRHLIDAGHGGKDGGGGTNSLWKEKDIVLKISLLQKKIFERHGIKVIMTRTDDRYLSPEDRTKIVRESGAAYGHSNHINSFVSTSRGAEIIHSIHESGKVAQGILDALVKEGAVERRIFSKKNDAGSDWYFMHRETGSVKINIIEYGNAKNAADAKAITDHWDEYAEAVARYYIENVYKKKYIPEGKTVTPLPAGSNQYKIQKGDTLWSISQDKGIELKDLLTANMGIEAKDLQIGQMISLPRTFKVDKLPQKSTHTFRLAKLIDTGSEARVEQLKKEGYYLIDLPSDQK